MKLKKLNISTFVSVLKASLIGVITSILLVLLFAFVLKFVDLNSNVISIVDQIIKILSIFIAVVTLNKYNGDKLLGKGAFVGVAYAIITFVVFSLLNGGFSLGVGIVSDIAFSAVVGGLSAILLNMISKK